MKLQNTHDVGIYCRLSRDDNNGNLESMSIGNQKQMLVDYVKEKGWSLQETYIDDGFSGAHFDRPDFKRLLRDISRGRIDCVITKDLSRLGRNYAKVGYYTEEFFIENGVRFIAINDSYDTHREEDNEIAPFKNVLNEWYPRDISKKVKQVKRATARQGKFIGSYAPYGYQKSPEDIHVLIIDDYAASIVRRIFNEFASGSTARKICDGLNRDQIDCPRFYSAKKKNGQTVKSQEHNNWGSASLWNMMRNQAYIGNMVQGKRQVVSFKTKKRRVVDPENYIVVENTHEPIIDRDLWDRVQSLMKTRTHRVLKRSNDVSLFAGVLRCADCGSKLVYTEKSRKYGPSVGSYRCSRYSNNSDIACSQHYIQENTLIAFVLKDIQLHAILADADRERISQQLVSSMNQAQKQSSKNYDRQAQVTEKRHKAIEETIKQLYEDKCSGKIPDLVFQNLLNGYITEQAELDQRLKLLREQQQEAQFTESEIEKWMQLISQHMEIKDLDRPTVLEMIESITISEARKVNGKRHQNITINYRFIGNLLGNAKEDII